jgi:hypothetical protein
VRPGPDSAFHQTRLKHAQDREISTEVAGDAVRQAAIIISGAEHLRSGCFTPQPPKGLRLQQLLVVLPISSPEFLLAKCRLPISLKFNLCKISLFRVAEVSSRLNIKSVSVLLLPSGPHALCYVSDLS